MTLENQLEFDLDCWKEISNDCKDIISKLLDKDPKKRITLDAALKHKSFSGLDINQETGILKHKEVTEKFKSKKGIKINV